MRTRARTVLIAALLLCVAGVLTLSAQRRFGRRGPPEPIAVTKLPYDGRFTFARIRFPLTSDARWDVKWAHDYPRAERHFMEILRAMTSMRPTMGGGTVLDLDDPDLFKFPVAYLSEPGFWDPSEADVTALRAYLQKGGFLIVDDFAGNHWYNFEAVMRRVLPDARILPLDVSAPIFDSFFRIPSLDYQHPYYGMQSQFLGMYEDDDPSKRLMVIVNYNNDIGDYMEWSDEGLFPVDMSNTAYKLAVNYVVYAMTH
jgi:hypothetical protein